MAGLRRSAICFCTIGRFVLSLFSIISLPMAIDRKDIEPFVNFDRLDEMESSYATLSDADRMAYDADLKAYRDLRGQLDFAEARGELSKTETKNKALDGFGSAQIEFRLNLIEATTGRPHTGDRRPGLHRYLFPVAQVSTPIKSHTASTRI